MSGVKADTPINQNLRSVPKHNPVIRSKLAAPGRAALFAHMNLPRSLTADGAFLWIVQCRTAAANCGRPKLLLNDLLRVGCIADAAALADQILIGGA